MTHASISAIIVGVEQPYRLLVFSAIIVRHETCFDRQHLRLSPATILKCPSQNALNSLTLPVTRLL